MLKDVLYYLFAFVR